nr:MAG TPA: hypothetical protein [Caudoviricetes sp.]
MAKVGYDIERLKPQVSVGYSGNPLDPAQVTINKALGSFGAIPPFIIPRKQEIITKVTDPDRIRETYASAGIIHSQMPMRVRASAAEEWFTLPIEPLVSVSGKNAIVRRKVAKSKAKGTVKERWSQDDYDITIRGVLTDADESLYPSALLKRLLALFDARQSIEVEQELLLVFGIKYLAIESASFPHTKGINNQNYEIKAYSDNPIELLISI